MKNRYYDRKVRESLEIDMAVGRYEQEKVFNRDNGKFVKTSALGKHVYTYIYIGKFVKISALGKHV